MKYTLFFLLFFSNIFAAPPIEGGKTVPLSNMDYMDVVRITDRLQRSCTGTRIAQNLLITAAHCVTDENLAVTFNKGSFIGMYGKLKKLHLHPSYAPAFLALKEYRTQARSKKTEVNKKKLQEFQDIRTLYDVAILEFEKKESKRSMAYIGIVSKDTSFNERKNVELVGYGATTMSWNGENFAMSGAGPIQRMGSNEWTTCPLPLINKDLQSISDFASDALGTLKIKALNKHTISGGVETIETNGKAMILKGDSGSPALERDINGRLVITGIASNISPGVEKGSFATLEIIKDGNILERIEFEKFPKDWGSKNKPDSAFPEIQIKLKELGLSFGDIQIKRSYTRATIGNFSDLSHPENQSFIRTVIEEAN